MRDHLLRKTWQYKISILVFVLLMPFILLGSWAHMTFVVVVLFTIQLTVVLMLMSKAVYHTQNKWQKEWLAILEEQVDPKTMLDQLHSNSKLSRYKDAQALTAICWYLLQDTSRAIELMRRLIEQEKKDDLLIIYLLNLCVFYHSNRELENSKEALEKAKILLDRQKGASLMRLHKTVVACKILEMMFAYECDNCSFYEYKNYIIACLNQEQLTRRKRLQLHHTLACLYMDQGNRDKAVEEVRYVEVLGSKTFLYQDIHNKLQAYDRKHKKEEIL